MAWVLWRQDEHGNEVLVRVFDDRVEAERVRDQFTASGHHQHYWLAPPGGDAPDRDDSSPTDAEPT